MATMYCALCRRPVEARRQIGVGTVVVAVLTFGASLLAVPFYRKRCSICKSDAVTSTPLDAGAGGLTPDARVAQLEQRLVRTEGELEAANTELERLRTERDFYQQLLENPASRGRAGPGE